MALTETQKSQIRRYLGYPDLFRYKNTRLEGALEGNLSASAETLVIADLALLVAIDTELFGPSGSAFQSAGVKKVDEIELATNTGQTRIDLLRQQGRSVAGRLSATFGVPFYADYFGGKGWPGDSYSELGGLGGQGQGGGPIPLG